MDVVWRNGTWTYGSWGGQGWAGGRFTGPDERVDRDIEGDDPLDSVFRLHDFAYENLQVAWDNSGKTEADCHRYYDALYQADSQMLVAINTLRSSGQLGPPPGIGTQVSGAYSAAAQATQLFVLKIQRDRLLHLQACDPDQDRPDFPPVLFVPWVIPIIVQTQFDQGVAWFHRADPLIQDLDNDGIELTASNSATLFDHNANGVAYSELKLWRDLNQDGVSQSNELLGFAEFGVFAINLTRPATQVAQGKSTVGWRYGDRPPLKGQRIRSARTSFAISAGNCAPSTRSTPEGARLASHASARVERARQSS